MPPIHDSTGPSSEAVSTVLGNLEQQQRQQAQSQATSGGDWLEAAIDGLELAVDTEAIFEGVTDALGSVAEVTGGALGGVAEAAGEALGGAAEVAGEAIAGLAGGILEGLLGG